MLEAPTRPDFGLPAAPSRTKALLPWIVVGALATILLVVGIFAVVQMSSLSTTTTDLEAADRQNQDLRADNDRLESKIALAEDENSTLRGDVSGLQTRVNACARAISIGVKMDGMMHDLVDNALNFGSVAEWNALWNRYNQLGGQWADAADTCSPASSYSFD